jgi:hypothetical protein
MDPPRFALARQAPICADKVAAPFKSGKFSQCLALDFAFAHAISPKMNPPRNLQLEASA